MMSASEPEYARLFEEITIQPLRAVIGSHLQTVIYVALETDDLEVNRPNQTGGCQAIRLQTDRGALELSAGWHWPFRQGGIGHHIQVETFNAAERLERRVAMDASVTAPWRQLVGRPVVGAEVFGTGSSPQLVRLLAPDAGAIVAAGYYGTPPEIGDGDELLAFED